MVRGGIVRPKGEVVSAIQSATAIGGNLASRTWLIDTLRCLDRLAPDFTLADVYGFEAELRVRHPANQHIRPKLRQQLQRLRDTGLVLFLGAGRYRRVTV